MRTTRTGDCCLLRRRDRVSERAVRGPDILLDLQQPTSMTTPRQKPNILITGTPGTGKTTMVQALTSQLPSLRAVDIGKLVEDKQLHTGWDEEYQSYVLDEDRLLDELEDEMQPGGVIVEYHGADLFPERWYDLVLVLRADTSVLYTRLESRGYTEKKLSDNVEAEIMQVILDEAREAYREEIVIEMPSNSIEDIESCVARTAAWMQAWKPAQG